MNINRARVAADGALIASAGRYLHSVILTELSGSAAAKVILYDNASAASGTVVATLSVVTSDTFQACFHGLTLAAGLYADVTGTCEVVALYE